MKGELDALLDSVDLLLLPVMGVAAPSLAAMRTRTPVMVRPSTTLPIASTP